MSGWNLPPGCSLADLPGNRPEDREMEVLYVKLDQFLQEFARTNGYPVLVKMLSWWWDDLPRPLRDRLQKVRNKRADQICLFCGESGYHHDQCSEGEQ